MTACSTLGTYTKSLHTRRGNRNEIDPERSARKSKANAGRYALMRTAQGLLWTKGAEWREQHRTCWCCRSTKRDTNTVSVYRNNDASGASLAGLNRCGDIWNCPTCAARISEARRKELSDALAVHVGQGGAAYLLTLTFPHEYDHQLSELLDKLTKARQRLLNSRTWKGVMSDAGRIGAISALEITASTENGWHPHVHMLVFTAKNGLNEGEPLNDQGDLGSDAIDSLKTAWINLLIKTGLGSGDKIEDMRKHALNVRGGSQAAEYIAKLGRDERWGASSEMTKSYAKQGAAGERGGFMHHTPFQLLAWAGNGDAWSIAKFSEYAVAIKGKRAITWSPGLKKALLGTEQERSDEEIAQAEEREESQTLIGELESDQYQKLLRHNRLPDFLRYVADSAGNQQDLDDYIDSIEQTAKTHSGTMVIRGAFGRALSDQAA